MKSNPRYRPPTQDEMTADVPRLVNPAWLVRALRQNAKACDKGQFLPWDTAQLFRRAATALEQLARPRGGA